MKSSSRLLFTLSMLYAGIILALGSWWLYLIVKYGEKIAGITGDGSGDRILTMVKWEGGTFLTLLILLSASLLYLYIRDQKKTRGLQAFYASMTHELKTPLASIKLQSEVLAEEAEKLNNEKVSTIVGRLLNDTAKMETQMDKILQLSRLEGGGHFNLYSVNILELIANTRNKVGHNIGIDIKANEDCPVTVMGDELALQLIFKNLLENTNFHSGESKALITLKDDGQYLTITYEDGGQFKGDPQKLGQLFYKHNSKKGTGIGLYLIRKLAQAMKGQCSIDPSPSMKVSLSLLKETSLT